jgi:nucleoid-associated protein EbfC
MQKQMQQMMQQVSAMQKKFEEAQNNLGTQQVVGNSGGGMVKITLTGKGEAKGAEIDASLLVATEKDVLEDLIVAAINNARQKVEELSGANMAEVTRGIPLPPGFKMPF